MPITQGTPITSFPIPTADAATNAPEIIAAIGAETPAGAQAKADAAQAAAIAASATDATSKTTTASIITKLEGATPEEGKIGEEYFPNVIEAEIELPINETTALPAGTITRDTKNRIRIHDAVTPGGVESNREFRVRGFKQMDFTGTLTPDVLDLTTAQVIELDKVVIPSNLVIRPSNADIFGNINFKNYLQYTTASQPVFVLYLRDAAGQIVGGSSIGGFLQVPFNVNGESFSPSRLSVNSNLLIIEQNQINNRRILASDSDGSVMINSYDSVNSLLIERATKFSGFIGAPHGQLGQDIYLCAGLYLHPMTSGTLSGGFSIGCDLTLFV